METVHAALKTRESNRVWVCSGFIRRFRRMKAKPIFRRLWIMLSSCVCNCSHVQIGTVPGVYHGVSKHFLYKHDKLHNIHFISSGMHTYIMWYNHSTSHTKLFRPLHWRFHAILETGNQLFQLILPSKWGYNPHHGNSECKLSPERLIVSKSGRHVVFWIHQNRF